MAVVPDTTIARAAYAAGFPRDQIATAVAVALAESGGDATAVNDDNADGTTDFGLWQINSVHRAELSSGTWQDPNSNARMAYAVWARAGHQWSPWVAWRNGSHLAHMPRGLAAARSVTGPSTVDVGGDPGDNPLIPDIIEDPGDALTLAGRILTDRDLWIRVGMFALGAALLATGIVGLIWTLGGREAVKTAVGVAT